MGTGRLAVVAALMLLRAAAQDPGERCNWFIAIPRDDDPNYPAQDFTGLTWAQRPLLPSPEARDDVCMDDFISGTQILYLEEEIEGEVIVAKLNYQGDTTPTIGVFNVGSRVLLSPEIRREPSLGNDWYLVIRERQDYETEEMQRYMFNVDIVESTATLTTRVSLSVVNIDDNPPVIQLISDCVVPELGEARATDCVYNVTDLDGEISTRFMTFSIEGNRGENELFELEPEWIPNYWFRMTITLRITRALDFAESALHIFSVTAYDSKPNTHTVSMMVQVENVEHRPPRWVEIWATQQFDEKTYQNFTVRAIDGDTGINKQILYRLEKPESYTFFSIDEETGLFEVSPIDRDELEQEVFQLQIVAYKFDNVSSIAASNVVIIVDDVNDQIPEPLHPLYEIDIPEETAMSLNFALEFGFHDRDLGPNAQYNVRLESVWPEGAAEAFSVAPGAGYQRQTFIMSVLLHRLLDYEELDWQNIRLQFIAEELHEPTHIGNATVLVNLINWNDEEPIFPQDLYEVQFNETEGAGFFVANVTASDRDIDDWVTHSLLGNAVNFLHIDNATGMVTVAVDDAFDYHRQNELFVQVQAVDNLGDGPYHTTTTQLVIRLYDVNNTPPSLRLPRGSPRVEENVPAGYIITEAITATDPDTTADLEFSIDWETSYATKQGRETDPVEFHDCVRIDTIFFDETQRGNATGRIVVQEIRHNVTIDFEEFEVLYLTIRVTDHNTVIGDWTDELTFTIIIEDMNDNPPVWAENTLDTAFSVREVSATDVVIGSVLATDIDGPLYNQVRYTIVPREDTLEDLVRIDFHTGQIEVELAGAIDADTPPRENLYYTVIASDCCTQNCPPPDPTCYNVPGNITIRIIDTNNKIPELVLEEFESVVYIWENATTGDEVVQLIARDMDRDDIYKTLNYQINYAVNPRLRDFFAVEPDTGLVHVLYTTDAVLDRDRGEETHLIFYSVVDNFLTQGDGNRNQVDGNVTVVLLDVNDNAPELPPPSELFWSISESLTEGTSLDPDIYAPDIDEPDTDNSRVSYDILSLTLTDRDLTPPELFRMHNVDNVTGLLVTNQDLRGYWGTYAIFILAYDFGHPQQSSNETYELVVRPYNFHDPEFVFPTAGTVVRLARERANVNGPLALTNGEFLQRIYATDEDGLHAGLVTFHVTGDADAMEFFSVANDGENLGTLVLTQLITEDNRQFQVTIRATDQGTEPAPRWTETTLTLYFVSTLGDPTFPSNTDAVAFMELENGLSEEHGLLRAEDPKNFQCTDDCHDIFYHIIDGNDEGYFRLEPTSNVLSLARELDRALATSHTLTVGATNLPAPPDTRPPPDSLLAVTVTVREADPRPRFERELYTAGISTADSINRVLLTLNAVHSEGAAVTYTIDQQSMVVDSSLEAVRDSAFVLDAQSGALVLNIQPTTSMHGMFEFDAVATDPDNGTDHTEVKVYLISSMNRVFFIFVNTLTQVEAQRDFIQQTFSAGFQMTCNIDQIVPASDSNGVALDDRTEVRAHFIQNDIPVDVAVIEELRRETTLLRNIQTTLALELLVMEDFLTEFSPEEGTDTQAVTQNVLIALSLVLALMCVVLLFAYCLKTRALIRRLDALSTTKFGSQDSGLNRAGVVVPGTNKHAVEGSNPIWNEQIKAPNFDALSEGSGDSDLIGIEDHPQFNYDYFPPADSSEPQGLFMNPGIGKPKNQDDKYAFSGSPFSPEFSNRPLQKY